MTAAARHLAATPDPTPTRRWHRLAPPQRLTCPHGHHLPETARINDSGFLRCSRWIEAERRHCGAWIFVFAIRGVGSIIAEVSLDEADEMAELPTATAMLAYLGIFA